MKTYSCPKCGAAISPDDINVSADLMLCRRCGETSSFADAVSEASDERILLKPPPNHLAIATDPMDPERRTTITYRRISPTALFLVPFTCFWAGGSMSMIYGSQIVEGSFDLMRSLFGIPFLVGSIVLVSSCLYMLFGKMVLELRGGEARYFAGVFGIGLRKRFRYGFGTKVSRGKSTWQQNRQDIPLVQVTPIDCSDKVRMFAVADADVVDYIVEYLRRAFR